jgi:hypothetical protein
LKGNRADPQCRTAEQRQALLNRWKGKSLFVSLPTAPASDQRCIIISTRTNTSHRQSHRQNETQSLSRSPRRSVRIETMIRMWGVLRKQTKGLVLGTRRSREGVRQSTLRVVEGGVKLWKYRDFARSRRQNVKVPTEGNLVIEKNATLRTVRCRMLRFEQQKGRGRRQNGAERCCAGPVRALFWRHPGDSLGGQGPRAFYCSLTVNTR